MKIVATTTLLVSAALLAFAAPAQADGDDHNCAGAASSFLAQALPAGAFGAAVSDAAQAQLVDNFGLANCGDTPRQNP